MKLNNNQQRGKDLESRMTRYLQNQGFWVHFMHPAPDGSQPFDLLALNGDHLSLQILAVDCKTLDGKRFPLDRVEDNQRMAFEALNKRGIDATYFAIEMEYNIIHLVQSQRIMQAIDQGLKSINVEENTYVRICIE